MEERQDHATRTISIVMIIALVGKVLGLYRDHLLAVYYGTGMAANAFNTASRIPRVFFDAVFASAISSGMFCTHHVSSEWILSATIRRESRLLYSSSELSVRSPSA